MERIVVCFRWRGARAEVTAEGPSAFDRALAELLRRRSALGARIVAWHARSFAFDFAREAIEEAIDLLVGEAFERSFDIEAFGIGVAQGELAVYHQSGEDVALAGGAAIERATELALIAARGDVLVDPALEAVRSGRLLTRGATMGTSSGQRIRGQRLDLRHPWRRTSPVRFALHPALVGTGVNELGLGEGQLGLIIASRGCGGSRFIRELARQSGARALVIQPWQVGEPLGALRDAFRRGIAAPAFELGPAHAASLEALLAGEGLEVEASGTLIEAWVSKTGAVLIDDVGEVDRDTIEAVAWACRDGNVKVLARVLEPGQLPSILGELPRGGEVILGALSTDQAQAIVQGSITDSIHESAVARWARRGGGRPLAILEAVRFGIEAAELVHESDSVVPRNRVGGRGGAQPARHWIIGRMRLMEEEPRALLDGLLVLGGRASPEELEEFLESVGVTASIQALVDPLSHGGWIEQDAGGHLALTSATLRDVLHELLSLDRRAKWHSAAAELRARATAPLFAARATLHAFMCGELHLLDEVARRTAAAARAAGLESTADAFDHLATTGDISLVMARGLSGGLSPRRPSRPSVPPPSQPGQSLHMDGTMGTSPDDGLTGQAAEALRRGDLTSVAALAQQLRDEAENEPLAERLEAMACLRRGETAEALRMLRAAKVRAQSLLVGERCRAALAYGVALSSAGRNTEALLEALEALARAREAGDAPGERACARFLAQLTEQAGHHEYARAWRALAD